MITNLFVYIGNLIKLQFVILKCRGIKLFYQENADKFDSICLMKSLT